MTCPKCHYTANEEKATGELPETHDLSSAGPQIATSSAGNSLLQVLKPKLANSLGVQFAKLNASIIGDDGKSVVIEDQALVATVSSANRQVNFLKVYDMIKKHIEQKLAKDCHIVRSDIALTPTIPDKISDSQSVHLLIDESATKDIQISPDGVNGEIKRITHGLVTIHPINNYRLAKEGDLCPSCHTNKITSPLKAESAIEVGHTFLLGTKYSETLDCSFTPRESAKGGKLPAQMGCYGIGVSRMSAAVIESLHDDAGMVWPTSIAPYRACILVADNKSEEANTLAETIYDQLNTSNDLLSDQVVLDDRKGGFGFKIRDAEMIGYPFVVIVGNKTRTNGTVEIRERIKGQKSAQTELPLNEVVDHLKRRVAEKLAV